MTPAQKTEVDHLLHAAWLALRAVQEKLNTERHACRSCGLSVAEDWGEAKMAAEVAATVARIAKWQQQIKDGLKKEHAHEDT